MLSRVFRFSLFFFVCSVSLPSFSQSNWTISDPGQTDVFIKNSGQFDALSKYVLSNSDLIFFSDQGYVLKMFKRANSEKKKAISEQPLANSGEKEENENRKAEYYSISMRWEGANPNARLIAEEEAAGYYTYASEAIRNLKAKGYRKLIYKDLYPGIDVEYIVAKKKGGIKYSIILKPGADLSKVKMHYSGDVEEIKSDSEGNLLIQTPAGNIIDHAPVSFYGDGQPIASSFEIHKKAIFFILAKDPKQLSQTIVIDPWTITPNLAGGNGPYDVAYDGQGNVYIGFVSSSSPVQISKYSSAGAFLWTLNMANLSDGSNTTYSKFSVIPSGSVFIANGFSGGNPCELDKVSSAGVLLNTVTWPTTMNDEGWMVDYNSCLNTLLIGGGGISNNICLRMGVDTSLNGVFTGNAFNGYTPGWFNNDIACMRLDVNGDMFAYFTTTKLAAFNNTIVKSVSPYTTHVYSTQRTTCGFSEVSGIPSGLGPGSETNTNRLNVMAINPNYLFFFDGQNLEARSKITGALITSTVVSAGYPCGSANYSPVYQNEGIAADNCNNVYVGGQGFVHVFNFNGTAFTALPKIIVPANVYDIILDPLRQFIYVAGNGFLNSIQAVNCITGGFAITPASTPGSCKSSGSASVTATGGTVPYTYSWSNGATSQTITASAGTYTVSVTEGPCTDVQMLTTTVIITPTNGPVIDTVIVTEPLCSGKAATAVVAASGGTGSLTYNWSSGAPGSSSLSTVATGIYTVTVSDASGCISTSTSSIAIPAAIHVNASQGNPSHCGFSTGTALASAAGGAGGVYTYLWSSGVAAASGQDTSLSAGIYTVTVTDKNNCSATASVTVLNSNGPLVSIVKTDSVCLGDSTGAALAVASAGTGPYTFSWSTGSTSVFGVDSSTVEALLAGTYTVTLTDAVGCTATALARISDFATFRIDARPDTSIHLGQSVQLLANTGAVTYLWSPANLLNDSAIYNPLATPTASTVFTVTVTDAGGCRFSDSVLVTIDINVNCDTLSIFMPTAFSPNGDGHNDVLYVRGIQTCITNMLLQIFDRWGELVFQTETIANGWDGTFRGQKLNEGVFAYYLTGSLANGRTISKKGNITLLR